LVVVVVVVFWKH